MINFLYAQEIIGLAIVTMRALLVKHVVVVLYFVRVLVDERLIAIKCIEKLTRAQWLPPFLLSEQSLFLMPRYINTHEIHILAIVYLWHKNNNNFPSDG